MYNKEYNNLLIKYSEHKSDEEIMEEINNNAIYEKQRRDSHIADFKNSEGHLTHDHSPMIYADWLEERDKPYLANLIRTNVESNRYRATEKDESIKHTLPTINIYHHGGYAGLSHMASLHINIPGHSLIHSYSIAIKPIKEINEIISSLKYEGAKVKTSFSHGDYMILEDNNV